MTTRWQTAAMLLALAGHAAVGDAQQPARIPRVGFVAAAHPAAREVFDGGPQAFGFMTSSMGIGAVIGGLVVAARGTTGLRTLTLAALGFGVTIAITAVVPSLWMAIVALFFVGWLSVSFMSTGAPFSLITKLIFAMSSGVVVGIT